MPKKDERGFWQSKDGDFRHPDMVPMDKQLEDQTVEKLVAKAKEVQQLLIEFKSTAYEECFTFIELLRDKYGMDRMESSRMGSVTLRTYNGSAEVQIQVAKLISFDQKLSLAKEKADEYLIEKTEHADPEIRTLITKAFEVKNGRIDVKKILALKSYGIKHPKWLQAMELIDDATEIAGTKSYIRFREREGGAIDGQMINIALDLAALPVHETKRDEDDDDDDVA